MKKVLSLVLAVMLVFGMGVTAFAAADDLTAAGGFDLGSYVNGTGGNGTKKLGVVLEQGSVLVRAAETIPATAIDVTAVDANGVDQSDKITVTNIKIPSITNQMALDVTADAVLTYKVNGTMPVGDYAVTIEATTGVPEILIWNGVLEVTKKPSTNYTTNVPTGYKITGFDGNWGGGWSTTGTNLETQSYPVDKTSNFRIVPSMFLWTDPDGNVADTATDPNLADNMVIRASQLSKVGVRRVYQKNTSNTIRDVELRTSISSSSDKRPDIRVRTVQHYTKTSATEVELKVALTYSGSTTNAPEFEISFTMENSKETIEEGQTDCTSYGHLYLEAESTVRNVEFEGDEDGLVFATKTVVKGQKYYFNVDAKNLTSSDEEIIAKYPEVDSIYNIFQTNMANATVEFKDLDREYFVYNQDGKLLGTTKDKKLPLAAKFILTTSKIDFGGAAVEEEPADEPSDAPAVVAPEAPDMGGGEAPAAGNYYNPNTGL